MRKSVTSKTEENKRFLTERASRIDNRLKIRQKSEAPHTGFGEIKIMLSRLKNIIFGGKLDPFDPKMRHSLALVAFLAWIGIGADGLSSSVYGPEEAYNALGGASALSPFLAIATALTVLVISLGYNQVIELFPSGGGGYKVASTLIGKYSGLVSGSALLIDYVLTITISVAACTDAVWSLAGGEAEYLKIYVSTVLIAFLLTLNIRGVREPIIILAPIFLGFLITHLALIVYGVASHAEGLPDLIPNAVEAYEGLETDLGIFGALALILKAYSLSAGTYTGIEAVSNNVHILAEPRVKTGKLTMLYMAVSLSVAAAGVTILYQLWTPDGNAPGMTLNATAFKSILDEVFGAGGASGFALAVVLLLEGLLLIVAANAGFLGGPAVLANMAADRWAPHAFSQLSTRLVTQNGILVMGAVATAVLWMTGGDVSLLVVLYSVNVFITFTLSLLGLVKFWILNPGYREGWKRRLILSLTGFILCASILVIMVIEKFEEGAWATIVATGAVVFMFAAIRRHYERVSEKLATSDRLLAESVQGRASEDAPVILPDPKDRVAVILVGRSLGAGIHELLTVTRLYPGVFQSFIFVSVGEVDTECFKAEESLNKLCTEVRTNLSMLVNYCRSRNLGADYVEDYGVDPVEKLADACIGLKEKYPNAIFFSTQLVFDRDSAILRMLHNQTSVALQSKLHLKGLPMMVLPMRV